jgi:hypothetical protein
MRLLFWLLPSVLLVGCGGGGGGGGGGVQTGEVLGRVIWIETGAAPDPVASVRAGTSSTTTDPIDGFFQVESPVGAGQLTVTFARTSGSPIVRTFDYVGTTGTVDVGDLYIGPQEVDLVGRVVDSSTSAPLGNAGLAIAGRKATSATDGGFRIRKVAYSPNGLAVFLGLQGRATRAGYFTRSFSPPSGPSGGVVDVGQIALTPEGSPDPPPPPFNLTGRVLPVAQGVGATVTLLQGASIIRTTVADAAAEYRIWAPAGTYTLRATKGSASAQRTVTISDPSDVLNVNVTFP